MSEFFDVIVLGCGAMGAAAALEVLSSNPTRRVLGLDRFSPPHNRGEHHGEVRMFRTAYYESPAYVPWLRYSLERWRNLERRTNRRLLGLVGALYMGMPDSELIAGSLRAAREHRIAHEVPDEAELKRRYPIFRPAPGSIGVLERDAGYVRCEAAVEAMLHAATVTGRFTLRAGVAVERWEATDAGVAVHAGGEVLRARSLIMTPGPWSAGLLGDLGFELVVTRQVQGWIRVEGDELARLPCWGFDTGGGTLFYGFPALAGEGGPWLKLARHERGEVVQPDFDRELREGDEASFMSRAAEFTPSLAGAPRRASICAYTNSPDGHFVIDRHPNHPNVVYGVGFSGHGFKLAPAVGRMLAMLVEPGPHPEPFFARSRLRR